MYHKNSFIKTTLALFIIHTSLFILPGAWAEESKNNKKAEQITAHTTKTVTLQFLSLQKSAEGNSVFKVGKPGEKYSSKDDLLLRFINRRDGYVYLISVTNNGVFIFFPSGDPEVFERGVHELSTDRVPQLYPLKGIRGDIFFIALYSDRLLDPKKEISPFFKDIKWLKDGNLDTKSLKIRFPGSAVDYFRIFVENIDLR